MSEEAKLGVVTKSAMEDYAGKKLTETEWEEIRLDIEGRVDNFVEELLQLIAAEQ